MILIRIAIIFLVTLFALPVAFGEEAPKEHQGHAMHSEHGGHGMDPAELTGDSIYNLESEWQNQDNATVQFSELHGKPRVIAMVYTFCPHVCPLIVSDMMRIRQEIPDSLKQQVGFVLVSIDPERDTPARLKSFAQKRSLDDSWTLLTADEDSVLELAVVLGVKFKKVAGGEYSHSNLISLVDAEGIVKHQQVGLNQDPEELVEHLKTLFDI